MSKASLKPKADNRYWLARDDGASIYEIYRGRRPQKSGRVYLHHDVKSVCIGDFLQDDFHRLFNVRLEPGQCREIVSASMKLKAPAKRK